MVLFTLKKSLPADNFLLLTLRKPGIATWAEILTNRLKEETMANLLYI